MTKPLVSVIMNGFNAAGYLKSAIDSVLAQSYDSWEIIFWDNCSSDETASIVCDFSDSRIRYFRATQFTPLGQARNLAIQRAQGEFIAFLDCDDLWASRKLEKQMPLFSDPEVGLVYSDTIFFNGRGDEKQSYGGVLPSCGQCFRQLLGRYFLSMETVVLRRAALESQTDWFDPRFNMIEEADLFRRIAYDWKIDGVPEPLARWRVHVGSWTFKYPDLLRSESVLMLEKYGQLYTGFNEEYASEISMLMDVIALTEARDAWLKGDKQPLVRHFSSQPRVRSQLRAFAILLWPASQAALALRLRGDILPDELLA
jgi:glycosyltransferase involved in cell wall biosynthesis